MSSVTIFQINIKCDHIFKIVYLLRIIREYSENQASKINCTFENII